MKINISHVKHKNVNALLMESASLAITIIPESGAKIQSIYDKEWQKEVLYQSGRRKFQKSTYGAKFDSGDVSGFDEIFPSIDECFYPAWPWTGTPVPDHGEVWALPWDYKVDENLITLNVHGAGSPIGSGKKLNS